MFEKHTSKLLATLGLLVIISSMSACAVDTPDQKNQHHQAGAQATLSLDNGKKWLTDKPLREGMENIRVALVLSLQEIRENKFSDGSYGKLSHKIHDEMNHISDDCKLGPKAKAQLHLILAEIHEGTESMEGKSAKASRQDGVEKVLDALENYNAYFDHAGWRPIKR